MFFEDARDLTQSAVRLLEEQKLVLGRPDLKIWPPSDFREFARPQALSRSERETIVEQAILLIDQFYAHLHFKRARYAVDPVQNLRIVQAQLARLSDREFHERVISALTSLRDAHTYYGLPHPYRGTLAFLPFRMKCWFDRQCRRRFIVTEILEGFNHPRFNLEAEILSWNGVPIEQAIEREGYQDPGGNPASRFARGINRMCFRPLTLSLPPEEEFVVLEYLSASGGSERFGIVLPWYVGTDLLVHTKRQVAASSVNESLTHVAQGRRVLFRRNGAAAPPTEPDLNCQSRYPEVFEFRFLGAQEHPDRKFGYLRIRTFDLETPDAGASDKFVDEFARIARLMHEAAPDGLILDVRGNPGGSIDAAERILQYLTPSEIEPAAFHFLNSRTTVHIARALSRARAPDVASAHQREWLPWIEDLTSSLDNGRVITEGRPLTQPEQANDTGQIYQGPVILIIDALAYSATDIFAAGFQDHAIGTIVGVDDNTGGGGANRWLHEELMQNLELHGLHDLQVEKLPRGAQLGLAIRRSSRVAANAGNVLEDVGVNADVRYRLTRRDLLQEDRDLIAFAAARLGRAPVYRLRILKAEIAEGGIAVSVRTRNLFRIECKVNGMAQFSLPAPDADHDFLVPVAGLLDPPETLTLNGFAKVEDEVRGTELRFVVTSGVVLTQPADLASHA